MRTREYIEHGEKEGKSLMDAMVDGDLEGMRPFDSDLERMVRAGIITERDALNYATNQNNLALKLGELGGRAVAPPQQKSSVRRSTPIVPDNPVQGLNGITDNIMDLFER